jgi:hypothetical protein
MKLRLTGPFLAFFVKWLMETEPPKEYLIK